MSGPTVPQAEGLESVPTMLCLKEKMKTQSDFEAHILAMFILYASRPRKREPDETGAYFIGNVGEALERNFQRWCPYSPAEPLR